MWVFMNAPSECPVFVFLGYVYMRVKEVKILWLVKSCQPVSDYWTPGGGGVSYCSSEIDDLGLD